MSDLYIKNQHGDFIPVSFEIVVTKDWEGKLIVLKVGSDDNPADAEVEEQTLRGLEEADALGDLEDTSFLVTRHSLTFEILGNLKEIEEKHIAVSVTGSDNLSDLGDLQKRAKKQLRGKTRKVVILPAPLTVGEYKEVMDVKRRCDSRRNRRG
jgi:hypothetical protein